MHPTLRHVPPREPRFSMQATYDCLESHFGCVWKLFSYLEASLTCFDRCNIARDTSADNHKILLL